MGLSPRPEGDWQPPILLASARDQVGISEVCDVLEAHQAFLSGERGRARRIEGRDRFIREELLRRYGSFGFSALGGDPRLREICDGDVGLSPYGLLEQLSLEIEAALAKSERNR